MVDQVDTQSDPLNLTAVAQKHVELCDKFYAERENYKVTKQQGDIKIRSALNDGRQVLMVECFIKDMVPDDWLVMIQNFEYYSLKYDKDVERMEKVQGAGSKYECFKIITKLPAMMTPRYAFLATFPFINYKGSGEHSIISTYEGMEPIFEQNLTDEEKSKWIHCQMHHCGYKIIPVKNESGEVVSCLYFCVADYSIGGSFNQLPKWLEYFMGEQGVMQTMDRLIQGVKQERMEMLNDEYRKNLGQLNQDFVDKCQVIKELKDSKKLKTDQKTKNDLFALQKQGESGNCTMDQPWWFEYDKKGRYTAWMTKKGLPMKEAQTQFIELVEKVLAAQK